MALRKAAAYSKFYKRAYTRRSTVRNKNYIKTTPDSKVTKFIMGDVHKFENGKFPYVITLVCCEKMVFIRDNAIEAARQFVHRQLEKNFKENFYFSLNVYPHQVLRENKMLTGAGADRMQTGMTLSFGVPVGIAARVHEHGKIFTVAVSDENSARISRDILNKVKAKMPGHKKVVTEKKQSS
ncbi:MAG: 50S ribosomal protein L16 [archaeon]